MRQDEVAIVTGAAQGIGRACAEALAAAGYEVVVADIDQDRAITTAGEIQNAHGVEVRAQQVDIAKPDQCQALVTAAAGPQKRLSILVNCATMYREADAIDQDPAEWANVINVGLNGAFYLSQAFAQSIDRSYGGCIVNISSVTATHNMHQNNTRRQSN